jgi:hypothetical protein
MTAAKKLCNREICFLFNEEGFLYKLFFAEKGKKEKREEKQKKFFVLFHFSYEILIFSLYRVLKSSHLHLS